MKSWLEEWSGTIVFIIGATIVMGFGGWILADIEKVQEREDQFHGAYIHEGGEAVIGNDSMICTRDGQAVEIGIDNG